MSGTVFVAGMLGQPATGFGVQAADFLAALQRVSSRPVRGLDMTPRPDGRYPDRRDWPGPDDAVIIVGGGPGVALFGGCPARKIAFTVWESNRLPDDWMIPLAMADEVWTPTAWGADVLRDNGVDPARVHVVPEGVDDLLFQPHGRGLPLFDELDGFRFLHVGKAEPRKGTFELLQAFDRAFAVDEPVYLLLACHNRLLPGFDTVRFIENMALRRRRWVVPVQPLPRRRDVAALYRSCDAFVAPSWAEGWGLPALEALASGLPTAVTQFAGHSAFADAQNSLAIPFRLVPVTPEALPCFVRGDGDYGEWADPDIDGLAEVMRTMVRQRDVLRVRALRQAAAIGQRWSWTAAALRACDRIEHLLARRQAVVAAC
ncbi:glycosyltransferase [Bradyrhizobium sp. 2TAF24]|uniref:glycosyltransferase n=1 Tax=Bradyrhizobium sp. 2TAF24 TaxID=3233011 RepID=UPI003F8FA26E